MQPLDADVVAAKFAALAEEIAAATGQARTPQQVAEGFLQIAVANMANAIKQVSVQKGHDATRFALQCFGGAGGQHACLVADALGMETVFIHPYAGVLSAYGMGLADQTVMREQAVEIPLEPHAMAELRELADRLADEATAALAGAGRRSGAHHRAAQSASALCRHRGRADRPAARAGRTIVADFTAAHRARFGFATPDRPLVVEAVAVEAIAPGDAVQEATLPRAHERRAASRSTRIRMFTGGARACRAGVRSHRPAGGRPHRRPGADPRGQRHHRGGARLDRGDHRARPHDAAPHRAAARRASPAGSERPDPVLLELFNNLFMNVAEQTGAVLQNTSMSVNIKERLDFSCAIFDAEGFLVANAPHVPVHLGAMGESVRTVLNNRARHAEAGRRRGAEQPVQRRHASAGRHRHHAGVRRGRRATSCSSSAAAAITPISAASRPAPRRRCRARWKRKAW